jgi:hypothetical protein
MKLKILLLNLKSKKFQKNVTEKNKKKVEDKVEDKVVEKDVVNKEKENLDKVVQTNKQKRIAARKQNKADRIKRRADRVAKTGGSKIGNALRGAKQLAKKVVKSKKEDDSALAMKKSPMKMAKKSPAKKALVGKQGNLPDHLVAKIKAAPGKMKKSAAKMKKYK